MILLISCLLISMFQTGTHVPCSAQSYIGEKQRIEVKQVDQVPLPETVIEPVQRVRKQQTYGTARQQSIAQGKPLLIFATSDNCVSCDQMWKQVLEPMQREGKFKDVSFTKINISHAVELRERLKIKSTPQLIVYRRDPDGTWRRWRMRKQATKEQVRQFIDMTKVSQAGNSQAGYSQAGNAK